MNITIYWVVLVCWFTGAMVYNRKQHCSWIESIVFSAFAAGAAVYVVALVMGEINGTECPRICE